MARNLRIASQLWASATVFFFFAFLFAYFYLRSLNSQGLWHPHHVQVPVGLGTAITACVVLSALASALRGSPPARRSRRHVAAGSGSWRSCSGSPRSSYRSSSGRRSASARPTAASRASSSAGRGCTSCSCSARCTGSRRCSRRRSATAARRSRGHEPGEASGDAERTGDDIEQPLSLIGPGARAFAFYWAVLAGIGVVTWLILYLL